MGMVFARPGQDFANRQPNRISKITFHQVVPGSVVLGDRAGTRRPLDRGSNLAFSSIVDRVGFGNLISLPARARRNCSQ